MNKIQPLNDDEMITDRQLVEVLFSEEPYVEISNDCPYGIVVTRVKETGDIAAGLFLFDTVKDDGTLMVVSREGAPTADLNEAVILARYKLQPDGMVAAESAAWSTTMGDVEGQDHYAETLLRMRLLLKRFWQGVNEFQDDNKAKERAERPAYLH